jgi:hypothetical protein
LLQENSLCLINLLFCFGHREQRKGRLCALSGGGYQRQARITLRSEHRENGDIIGSTVLRFGVINSLTDHSDAVTKGPELKLHRDGATSGADDPEAHFFAGLLHAFGATYNGKGGA